MKNLFYFILIWPTIVTAQWQNTELQDIHTLLPDSAYSSRKPILSNLMYLKNNEYFNLIHPGQTFFGTQLELSTTFRKKAYQGPLTLRYGALLQQDFGDTKFPSKVLPKITLSYQGKNSLIEAGALRSHVNHGMHDAMLNYENALTNPVEYGASFTNEIKHLQSHAWLEWRSLANIKDQQPEEIIFGTRLQYLINPKGPIVFSIPAQALIYHKGGQGISNPIITRINTLVGLQAQSRNKRLTIGSNILLSADNSPQNQQAFSRGYAFYSYAASQYKNHGIHAAFWHAYQYTNTLGNPIFGNVNISYPYANQQVRQLVSLRYGYSVKVTQSSYFNFRVEPFYDLYTKKLEHSAAIFFRSFWL
jgi:hypothetical protein